MNRLLAWLSAIAASLFVHIAFADASLLMGVMSDSIATDKVAASVRESLPGNWKAMSKADFDAAFKAARKEKPALAIPLAAALKADKKRDLALDKLRLALSNTQGKAALFITVFKGGKKGFIRVYLVSASNSEQAVEQDVPLDDPSLPESVIASIKPTLEKWAPPPVAEKPKAEDKPVAPVAKEAPVVVEPAPHKGEIEHALGIVEVGVEIGGRALSYTNPTTANLRPYDLFGGFAPAIDAEIYPGARSNIAFLKDLGITGGFRMALGLSSKLPDGTGVSTAWNRFDAGLRYRLRFGDGRKPQIGIRFGISRENFTFSTTATDYPAATYFALRPGVDVWVPIGILGLFGEFDVMPTLSAGETAARFSDASVFGFGGRAGLALTPNDWLFIRSWFSYERYGYSITPKAGDAFAATGAGDGFMRIHVGAGAHF